MTPFFTTFPRNLSFIEIEVLCDKKKKLLWGEEVKFFPCIMKGCHSEVGV